MALYRYACDDGTASTSFETSEVYASNESDAISEESEAPAREPREEPIYPEPEERLPGPQCRALIPSRTAVSSLARPPPGGPDTRDTDTAAVAPEEVTAAEYFGPHLSGGGIPLR